VKYTEIQSEIRNPREIQWISKSRTPRRAVADMGGPLVRNCLVHLKPIQQLFFLYSSLTPPPRLFFFSSTLLDLQQVVEKLCETVEKLHKTVEELNIALQEKEREATERKNELQEKVKELEEKGEQLEEKRKELIEATNKVSSVEVVLVHTVGVLERFVHCSINYVFDARCVGYWEKIPGSPRMTLYNFNVRILEQGSLGMRLIFT